jgi:hypothetical protein
MFRFLHQSIRRCAEKALDLGGQVQHLEIAKPATPAEMARLERRLKRKVPPQLGSLLRTFSKKVLFIWQWDVPAEARKKLMNMDLLWGEVSWDIQDIRVIDPRDYWWAEEIVEGHTGGEWLGKILLHTAPDGDFVALGTEGRILGKPVYLAHDGTDPRDLVLHGDLLRFFREWSRIGFLMINDFWGWRKRTRKDEFDFAKYAALRDFLSRNGSP